MGTFDRSIENSHRHGAWWDHIVDPVTYPSKRGDEFPFYGIADTILPDAETHVIAAGWPNTSGPPLLTGGADQITLVSDSANDTAAGSGARKVIIVGISSGENFQWEEITMNGAGLVTSVNTYLTVLHAYVSSAGSTGWNVGNISLADQGATSQFGEISAENSATMDLVFFCPEGYEMYIDTVTFPVIQSNVYLSARSWADSLTGAFISLGPSGIATETPMDVGRWFPAGTLAWVSGINNSGGDLWSGGRITGMFRKTS